MLKKSYTFRTNFLKNKNSINIKRKNNSNYIKIKEPPKRNRNKNNSIIGNSNINQSSKISLQLNQKKIKKNNYQITIANKKVKNALNKKNKIFRDKTDNELNSLSYHDAIIEDKRTFFQIYFSLLCTNQILFFAFKPKNDYNSLIIKICFIFYIFTLLVFFNTAFILDDIVYIINLFNGKWQLSYSYISIIFSTLITCIIKNILIEIIFTESDVLSIKYTFNNAIIKKIIGIIVLKCILFFLFGIISLFCIWVYIACFFTVFKNTQHYAIMNASISFGIFLFIPIIYYIFPALIRFISLLNRKKSKRDYLYIISKILLILI